MTRLERFLMFTKAKTETDIIALYNSSGSKKTLKEELRMFLAQRYPLQKTIVKNAMGVDTLQQAYNRIEIARSLCEKFLKKI